MHATPPPTAITVAALHRYPIKSCAGTALAAAEIGPRGVLHDRDYVIVDAATGEMLTQRSCPQMALIRPTVGADGLVLAAPGMPPLAVPPDRAGEERAIAIWRDPVRAVDQGDAIATWLGAFLERPSRLLRMADDAIRPVNPANPASRDGDRFALADGYPLLLISEESLAGLNARLAEPVPMDRFRPNLVVAGAGAPHAEDGWRRVRIGEVSFRLAGPCVRCQLPTIDQATAARGKEPLTTLARYRRGLAGRERGVVFGQNAIHDGPGTIRVGDRVEVLAEGLA